jgi:hypothetical protein
MKSYKVEKSLKSLIEIQWHEDWKKRKEEEGIDYLMPEPGVEYISESELESRFGLKHNDLDILGSTYAKEKDNYLINNGYHIEESRLKTSLELDNEEYFENRIKDLL